MFLPKCGDYEVKGHRCIRTRSNHLSVSLSILAGADIKYEPPSAALDSWDLQVVDIINHNLLWQAPKLEQKANSSMNVECFRPRAASQTFGTRLSSLTFGDIALSSRKQCFF